jgi:hypothetical protein
MGLAVKIRLGNRKYLDFTHISVEVLKMAERDWKIQMKVLGWLHLLANSMFLLLGLLGYLFLSEIGAALGNSILIDLLNVIGIAGLALFAILAVPGLIAGIGLVTERSWARLLALAVSVLNLVNFPLGTAVAIYTFWVLASIKSSKQNLSLKPT